MVVDTACIRHRFPLLALHGLDYVVYQFSISLSLPLAIYARVLVSIANRVSAAPSFCLLTASCTPPSGPISASALFPRKPGSPSQPPLVARRCCPQLEIVSNPCITKRLGLDGSGIPAESEGFFCDLCMRGSSPASELTIYRIFEEVNRLLSESKRQSKFVRF